MDGGKEKERARFSWEQKVGRVPNPAECCHSETDGTFQSEGGVLCRQHLSTPEKRFAPNQKVAAHWGLRFWPDLKAESRHVLPRPSRNAWLFTPASLDMSPLTTWNRISDFPFCWSWDELLARMEISHNVLLVFQLQYSTGSQGVENSNSLTTMRLFFS